MGVVVRRRSVGAVEVVVVVDRPRRRREAVAAHPHLPTTAEMEVSVAAQVDSVAACSRRSRRCKVRPPSPRRNPANRAVRKTGQCLVGTRRLTEAASPRTRARRSRR